MFIKALVAKLHLVVFSPVCHAARSEEAQARILDWTSSEEARILEHWQRSSGICGAHACVPCRDPGRDNSRATLRWRRARSARRSTSSRAAPSPSSRASGRWRRSPAVCHAASRLHPTIDQQQPRQQLGQREVGQQRDCVCLRLMCARASHAGAGDCFGEIALLVPGVRRTASIVATTFCEAHELFREDFAGCLHGARRRITRPASRPLRNSRGAAHSLASFPQHLSHTLACPALACMVAQASRTCTRASSASPSNASPS